MTLAALALLITLGTLVLAGIVCLWDLVSGRSKRWAIFGLA